MKEKTIISILQEFKKTTNIKINQYKNIFYFSILSTFAIILLNYTFNFFIVGQLMLIISILLLTVIYITYQKFRTDMIIFDDFYFESLDRIKNELHKK